MLVHIVTQAGSARMKPEEILSYPARALKQAQREQYFEARSVFPFRNLHAPNDLLAVLTPTAY